MSDIYLYKNMLENKIYVGSIDEQGQVFHPGSLLENKEYHLFGYIDSEGRVYRKTGIFEVDEYLGCVDEKGHVYRQKAGVLLKEYVGYTDERGQIFLKQEDSLSHEYVGFADGQYDLAGAALLLLIGLDQLQTEPQTNSESTVEQPSNSQELTSNSKKIESGLIGDLIKLIMPILKFLIPIILIGGFFVGVWWALFNLSMTPSEKIFYPVMLIVCFVLALLGKAKYGIIISIVALDIFEVIVEGTDMILYCLFWIPLVAFCLSIVPVGIGYLIRRILKKE